MSIGSHPTAAMGDEHQAAEQFYFIACISDYAICCGEDRRTLGGLYIDAFIALSADAWAEGRQYGAFERPVKFDRKDSRLADCCGGGQGLGSGCGRGRYITHLWFRLTGGPDIFDTRSDGGGQVLQR